MPDLHRLPFQIAIGLLKHHASKLVGDETLEVIADELLDAGEEGLLAKVDEWLKQPAAEKQISAAIQKAEACFADSDADRGLREAVSQLSLDDESALHGAIIALPRASDEGALRDAIAEALTRNFRTLPPQTIDLAVDEYLRCLRQSLLTLQDTAPTVVGRAVLRMEAGLAHVEEVVERTNRRTERIEEKIDALAEGDGTTEGGVEISHISGGQVSVEGDMTGRDKVEAGGHIIHAEAGATVIISGETPRSPETTSAIIGQSLNALIDLMQAPGVRDAVVAFQTDLRAASGQISILSDFKAAHDLFQELENRYYLIAHDGKRLPADETAWDGIELNEPELRGKINDLMQVMQRASFAKEETSWTQHLTKARDELRDAVEDLELKPLQTATYRLFRVLDRQPSRINARLVATAGALRLAAIVEAMATIRDELSQHELDLEAVRQFESGVTTLAQIDVQLTSLVRSHSTWQAIDDELRRVEANLEQDLFELELAWPDLQPLLAKAYDGVAENWARSMQKTSTQLESALAGGIITQVKRFFRRLRSQAGRRFRQVNGSLLSLCQELGNIGAALNQVLRALQ